MLFEFICCVIVLCTAAGFVAGCVFASGVAFDNGRRYERRQTAMRRQPTPGFSVVPR